MTKTFCDFCENYIPNPTFFNAWYLPIWEEGVVARGECGDAVLLSEKGVVSRAFCLCDTCIQDMATIINRYKNDRKRERF